VNFIWEFLLDASDLTNIAMRQEENCNNYTERVKGHVCQICAPSTHYYIFLFIFFGSATARSGP